MPKRQRSVRSRPSSAIVIRQSPAPAPMVMRPFPSPRAPARRRGGGGIMRSSLFSVGGRSGSSILPVKETIQGGGGGVLAGLIDDVIPKALVTSDRGRAVAVFAVGSILAWATGMPPLVIAGIAGGVSRKLYDDMTS